MQKLQEADSVVRVWFPHLFCAIMCIGEANPWPAYFTDEIT